MFESDVLSLGTQFVNEHKMVWCHRSGDRKVIYGLCRNLF